ncbi:MAG: hypothetical protein KDA88_21665 [Planctomycetaceae bacterium]|nr:hypothetical protein [Planctomycetaceae bacterium]
MAVPCFGQFIVAHRGASYDAPENTLPAFKLAWEKGADAIEGDFYLTKDQQIVCIHDKDTKRTGKNQPVLTVAESTLAELRKVDVGSWKDAKYKETFIPTIQEVLATVPDGKKLFLEVKCGPEIVPFLAPEIKKSGLKPDQVTIICFNEEVIKAARKQLPQLKANWLTGYKQNATKTAWRPSQTDVLTSLKRTGATGLGTQGNLTVIDESFVDAVRKGGFEFHVWTVNEAEEARRFAELDVDSITTDRPALIRKAIEPQAAAPFEIERHVMTSGYDGKQCWVHARAGVMPPSKAGDNPTMVLTTQRLEITGSDVFHELHSAESDDRGATWSELQPQPEFKRWKIDERTDETICDFTPGWHAASAKLLGTGQSVRYYDNKVMKVRPRFTGYSVYDRVSGVWSKPKALKMPDEERFQSSGAGSVQRYDLPDGRILLPVYFKRPEDVQYSVTVCLCEFDGETLSYVRHGNEMTVNVQRGFAEPSLTKFGDRFFLTLRNDEHGYVTSSADGLHFDEPKPWTFDDGSDLGNYNTQQHWITHSSGLYLVYTRKGANNDHVFRHRAPLFIAQVDPEKLQVIRATEQIVVPERGARLGNFGITQVSNDETWVVVTEWMQTWKRPSYIIPVDNEYGADNSVFIAKILWK